MVRRTVVGDGNGVPDAAPFSDSIAPIEHAPRGMSSVWRLILPSRELGRSWISCRVHVMEAKLSHYAKVLTTGLCTATCGDRRQPCRAFRHRLSGLAMFRDAL